MKFYLKHNHGIRVMLNAKFLRGLLECILMTNTVKGDIIELGSFRGGSVTICAYFLKKIKSSKIIYACDTFEGLPNEDKFSKKTFNTVKGVFSKTSIQRVEEKFKKYGVLDKIKIIKGRFKDTLESQLSKKRFSLAFDDCDLYDSTKYTLNFLYSRIEDNRIICFHDFYPQGYKNSVWGITKAVEEFLQKKQLKIQLNPITHLVKNYKKN